MGIDTNNIQINTFVNGMDTDTSDMLIDNDAYRMAENLRYITDVNETTGELRLIEGAQSINIYFANETEHDTAPDGFRILAYNSIRNIGALICTRNKTNNESIDPFAVYRVEYREESDDLYLERVFGWCEYQILTDTKISTVMKWEDDDQLQLYIANGNDPIFKINLYDTTMSTDINYISSRPLVYLETPQITEILSGGSLMAGLVQYSYQLYNENNISTVLSPLSSIKSITGPFVNIGSIGLMKGERSSMGLLIEIQIPTETYSSYKYIKLFRILYTENGQLPLVSLIYDQKYSVKSEQGYKLFTYKDFGQLSLLELTSEEFNSLQGVTIIPKVIERKNNILFAGNIKYDIDDLDETYLNMDFRAFSTGDKLSNGDTVEQWHNQHGEWPSYDEDGNAINENLDISIDYDVNKWRDPFNTSVIPFIGGSGPHIRWRLNGEEDYGEVLNSVVKDDDALENSIKLIKSLDRYEKVDRKYLAHDEIYRYGIILYSKYGAKYPTKWICDIRTPNIGNQNTSLYYNSLILVNDIYNTEDTYDPNREIIGQTIYPIIMYAEFKVNTSDLDQNKISGYEIVRVNRTVDDSATITQGMVAATAVPITDVSFKDIRPKPLDFDGRVNKNRRCSTGFPFLDFSEYITIWKEGGQDVNRFLRWAITSIDVMLFYSPEVTYSADEVSSIIKNTNGLYLLPVRTAIPLIPPKTHHSAAHSIPLIDGVSYSLTTYADTAGYLGNASNSNNDVFGYSPFVLVSDGYRYKKHAIQNGGNYPSESGAVRKEFTRNGIISDSDMVNSYLGYTLYKIIHGDLERNPVINDTQYNPIFYVDIEDCDKVSSTGPKEFISGDNFKGFDTLSFVKDITFYNSVIPTPMANIDGQFSSAKFNYGIPYNPYNGSLIATCDPSLILKVNELLLYPSGENELNIFDYYHSPVVGNRGDEVGNLHEYSLLCNIRKKHLTPYGGYDFYTRNTNQYVSKGNYFKRNSNSWILMFDGDTKVTMFEFVPAHKWYDATHWSPRASIICQVPVESRMDLQLDSGEKFSNNKSKSSLVLVEPCNFNELYVQQKKSYMYNTVYSSSTQLLINTGEDTHKEKIESFDSRVHYSNYAQPLQSIDPWLIFQPLNYLDVDSQYGPITNLRTFKNQLLFWQERSAGVLSVNERVQIADQSNLPLILGTGGVLDRYDYLTTSNGMKENQHADAQSEQALYWWDGVNNTICSYGGGNGIVQFSKAKKVLNLLNKWYKEGMIIETDLRSSLWPTIIYDKKYNEVLFKVGGVSVNTLSPSQYSGLSQSLVYNELAQHFTSIYTIDPSCYLQFGAQLILFDQSNRYYTNHSYKWNQNQDDDQISKGFYDEDLYPYIKFVINRNKEYTKVYDNMEFAGTIPGCFDDEEETLSSDIKFRFNTPLKLMSMTDGESITNRQYDFKFAIPRSGEYQMIHGDRVWVTREYGDRLRGKTMQCEMSSTSNSLDFSLQYFITKYRMSWS